MRFMSNGISFGMPLSASSCMTFALTRSRCARDLNTMKANTTVSPAFSFIMRVNGEVIRQESRGEGAIEPLAFPTELAFEDLPEGDAVEVDDALEKITALKPDLLFLDIQMPGADGFSLLERLEPPLPMVIFTTAYDEFAVKAFDFNALDYLLKPVDPSRLGAALEKLRRLRKSTESDTAVPPSHRLALEDKVFVREGERCWFVPVKNIRLLESEGNYTRLHFDDQKPQLFRSLTAMEDRLDPRHFFRANRKQVINLTWVEGIEPWFSGGLLVKLKGGPKVELSRRQAQDFRERMSL